MTESDIERMAREAGFEKWHSYDLDGESELDRIAVVGEYPCGEALARFAVLVRAQALEQAAQTAEAAGIAACDSYGDGAECIETGERCAAAIRALAPPQSPAAAQSAP